MDNCLVFIDGGFLSKLKKELDFFALDILKFSDYLAQKEKSNLQDIFYYNAPPFQSAKTIEEERRKKEKYDKFKDSLVKQGVIFREGRCQRLKVDGSFKYSQKAVDVFLAMDLTGVPIDYPDVKKVILIACDSDFVPVIKKLHEKKIKTILYTYYERKRDSKFSRSNDLIKSVYKYKLIKKEDFESCKLK